MPKRPTRRSTPRLSELARHVVAPKGVVSTGWPAVEKKCLELGIRFRPWQPDVGRLILAKREDGKYAATIGGTGLSIPRQVGKTFLVGAIVFALCLLKPNLTVIWTSHRLRTSEETFKKMRAFAKRKRIAPHVLKVVLGSGDEAIEFRNGSRILFGARERGFGRGFDEVDVLIFDEAQILTENALDDMIPATNQSRQPTSALLLFMGTPPKPKDPGEVFRRMRTEALTGEDDDTGWVEFGSDPGHVFPALPAPLREVDWKQIAKANPSFPEDTPREAILRMRKKLGADSFSREGAGLWDEDDATGIFPTWNTLSAEPPKDLLVHALGIATDRDQVWLSLGAVVASDKPHLAVVDRARTTARKAFAANVARIQRERGCEVLIRGKTFVISDLEEAGVGLRLVDSFERAQAHADLATAIENAEVEHGDYPELNAAVVIAQWRATDTGRSFDARVGDISALDAVALAHHGVESSLDYDPLSSVL